MLFYYALAHLVTTALAGYSIVDDYTQGSFADKFNFFTENDPTNGYVNYVDYGTAQSSGLYSQSDKSVYIGVDHNNTASGRGRNSVRIESKKSYQHGLIILDLAHMPGGACGTWPAFWLLSTTAQWPNGGEVDIIEGVNSQDHNTMAVHTNADCSISNNGGMSGQVVTTDCNIAAPNQDTNQGCATKSTNTATYGSGFNSNGGGVYATEWTSNGFSIWFFPRSSIPSDVASGTPNPSGWGLPLSRFAGACDWDEKVVNQQIIFDVTFCGDWAGGVWGSDATCSSKASTCQSFVQSSPSAFTDTYWSVNSLKVFQQQGQATTTSTTAVSTTSTTVSQSTTSSTTTTPTTSSFTTTFITLTTTQPSSTSTTTSSSTIQTSATTTLSSVTTTSTAIQTSVTTTSTSSFTTTITTTTPTTTLTTTIAYTTSYPSSWTNWPHTPIQVTTSSIPYVAPLASSSWNNPWPSTFYTVIRPSGGPSNNWGPPNGSGPGRWGERPGPAGPPL